MITLAELLSQSTKAGICDDEFDEIYQCTSFREILEHEQAKTWMRRLWKKEVFPIELLPAWSKYEKIVYEAHGIFSDATYGAWRAFLDKADKVDFEKWTAYKSKERRAEQDYAEAQAAAWAVFAKEVMAILEGNQGGEK